MYTTVRNAFTPYCAGSYREENGQVVGSEDSADALTNVKRVLCEIEELMDVMDKRNASDVQTQDTLRREFDRVMQQADMSGSLMKLLLLDQHSKTGESLRMYVRVCVWAVCGLTRKSALVEFVSSKSDFPWYATHTHTRCTCVIANRCSVLSNSKRRWRINQRQTRHLAH
jgi:hypothetical protein